MDPLSVSASAAGLITLCLQSIRLLKFTIETLKHAKSFLLNLLSQTERVRLFLEQLRGISKQLGSGMGAEMARDIVLAFNDKGVERTLRELEEYVGEMVGKNGKGNWMRFRVLVGGGRAEGLVARLRRHEEEILAVVLWICATSSIRSKDEVEQSIDEALARAKLTRPFASTVDELTLVDQDDDEASVVETKSQKADVIGREGIDHQSGNEHQAIAHSIDSVSPSTSKECSSHIAPDKIQTEGSKHPQSSMNKSFKDPIPQTQHLPIGISKQLSQLTNVFTKLPSSVQPQPNNNVSHQLSEISKAFATLQTKKNPVSISTQPLEESKSSKHPLISPDTQIWFGYLGRSGYSPEYLQLRDALSDSAYRGQIGDVMDHVSIAKHTFGQNWVNAPRLNWDPSRASGWTPLHQAVYMGASRSEIQHLIHELGALRLLRTLAGGPGHSMPYPSMTAHEMAKHIGYAHLDDLLAPIIHHSLPPEILHNLQEKFHGLIREDLGRKDAKGLRLPVLEVLVELVVPMMWFPLMEVKGEKVRGYMYRLDGRELLVKTFGVSEGDEPMLFRISTEEVREIEDAVVFDG